VMGYDSAHIMAVVGTEGTVTMPMETMQADKAEMKRSINLESVAVNPHADFEQYSPPSLVRRAEPASLLVKEEPTPPQGSQSSCFEGLDVSSVFSCPGGLTITGEYCMAGIKEGKPFWQTSTEKGTMYLRWATVGPTTQWLFDNDFDNTASVAFIIADKLFDTLPPLDTSTDKWKYGVGCLNVGLAVPNVTITAQGPGDMAGRLQRAKEQAEQEAQGAAAASSKSAAGGAVAGAKTAAKQAAVQHAAAATAAATAVAANPMAAAAAKYAAKHAAEKAIAHARGDSKAFGNTWFGRDSTTDTTTMAPVNCRWGEWDNWGKCTETCGTGEEHRERSRDREAENGGEDCEGKSKETKACHKEPCPVKTPAALPVPLKPQPVKKIDDNTKLFGLAACGVAVLAAGWYFTQQKPKTEQQYQEEARMEYDPQYFEDEDDAAYHSY